MKKTKPGSGPDGCKSGPPGLLSTRTCMEWGLEFRFVVAILATWRVAHLLANEDGPADIVVRLRAALGESVAGKLMDCFNCLSLWVAAVAALFVTRRPLQWLVGWLAISGGACLLERLGQKPVLIRSAAESSEGDLDHVLRSEAVDNQGKPEPKHTVRHFH